MATSTRENVLPIEGTGRVLERYDRRIGSILAEEGKLVAQDIERVMELQQTNGLRFGEAALRLGLITDDDLRCAVAKQYDLPHLVPGSESVSRELVVAYDPFHPRAEELRALRTQLQMRWSKAGVAHKMLAITSSGRGEGRSYVAANLAVAFSQLGERTLLVDADLREPRQHRIFNIPDRVGLTAVLSGRADRDAVTPAREFGRLSLLPAGAPPPNPQELLSRPALGAFLREMGSEFDVILFDTPPARSYADALNVAFRAGNAMLLVRKNHTRLADTTGLVRELSDTGVRVVGTVLNVF
ncbi:MAG TPA: chain length determinant protein tyrosine kinase EpsG [Burkholderiales bacterium]|nr:chain length determinant protein tyrosine kinase EpsG [Burkholderiales bacterium]